jgi:hypothetical protein
MEGQAIYLVGDANLKADFAAARPRRPRSKAATAQALTSKKPALWISRRAEDLDLTALATSPRADRRLLLFEPPPPGWIPVLAQAFRRLVVASAGVFLPAEEIAAALTASNRHGLLIGVVPDHGQRILVAYRGDLSPMVVPFDAFRARRSTPPPDFDDIEVIDGGQTIRLGDFEASVDALLYELDPDYRRHARKRAIRQATGLGASIRRLRLQKGLRRTDFDGLTEKTIARIERGETTPRPSTVRRIARRLGVSPDALGTF